jgi:hypothetical protein
MKRKVLIFILVAFILTSCSGLPMRLKTTSEYTMHLLNADLADTIENQNYPWPVLLDARIINENKWCLTYELGPLLYFSSIWEKEYFDWVQTKLYPYEYNCE